MNLLSTHHLSHLIVSMTFKCHLSWYIEPFYIYIPLVYVDTQLPIYIYKYNIRNFTKWIIYPIQTICICISCFRHRAKENINVYTTYGKMQKENINDIGKGKWKKKDIYDQQNILYKFVFVSSICVCICIYIYMYLQLHNNMST